MSRLKVLFEKKKERVLNVYCTAGYPYADATMEVITALQHSGTDIIELGMPYSDPLADGPVIQQSSAIALQNGMTIGKLFSQLEGFRDTIQVPVILMGYLNPVLQFGMEKFCAAAKAAGIDGIILPDLPLHEYETEYKALFVQYGLDFIFLVTPETSEERIRKIDSAGSGFIYAVSSSATTGNTKSLEEQVPYFKKLEAMQLSRPVLVGFGIRDKATFDTACRHSNGAIIGSAYIAAISGSTDIQAATATFLNGILK